MKEDGDFKEAMRVLDMANMMCDDRSREMIEKEVRVVEVALRRTTEEELKKKRPNTTSIETEAPPKKNSSRKSGNIVCTRFPEAHSPLAAVKLPPVAAAAVGARGREPGR